MNKLDENNHLILTERHEQILALLRQRGSMSVVQLSEYFKVSEVTIRKDLTVLEQQKRLYRTHGSAILISPYIGNRHVNEKEKRCVAEKQSIGAAAATLIAEDDSVIIASGTTMTFLSREIQPKGRLTVITSSVLVTQILSQQEQADVIQLGGITRRTSMSVVGPFAERMLHGFNCSKLFIGVDGVDPDFGLTTTDMMEASLNRAMIDAAQKVIVLADSSKFGRRGFSKICGIEDVDLVITDSGTPKLFLDKLREQGIEVWVVEK
ncbi:MAG: DeoR/GlpR transcriptional regulator [Rikenellaceae bacterium]|nr:DeoR/GlpR transcriptional regulator [Rikenellaceae bacterium]